VFSTDQKGNIAETAIIAHATRAGIEVFRPVGEGGRFDLIFVLAGGTLSRVQCKWGSLRDDTVLFHAYSCRRTAAGIVRRAYSPDEVDAFAVYCLSVDCCWYIPARVVCPQREMSLRLRPAKNNQRKSVHFAAQYELGAIAQLGERLHGMQEVAGSSPASSTSHEAA
jgi:hypothetical protein